MNVDLFPVGCLNPNRIFKLKTGKGFPPRLTIRRNGLTTLIISSAGKRQGPRPKQHEHETDLADSFFFFVSPPRLSAEVYLRFPLTFTFPTPSAVLSSSFPGLDLQLPETWESESEDEGNELFLRSTHFILLADGSQTGDARTTRSLANLPGIVQDCYISSCQGNLSIEIFPKSC
jgi:hypothetical protein